MTTQYCGYRPYAARESTLTWAPHVPSRDAQTSKFHAKRLSTSVPDATETSSSCASAASAHFVKDDFRAPPSR